MSYSDYLVQWRTRGQDGSPAAAGRQHGGREAWPDQTFGPPSARDVLLPLLKLRRKRRPTGQGTGLRVLDPGRSGFLDSGQGAGPAVTRPQPWRREIWLYRSFTDLRPTLGDKVRDFAELIVVAVYMAAVFVEMALLLGPAVH